MAPRVLGYKQKGMNERDITMLKRTTVIRWVTTPTRQSLASSRKRTLRRRPAMAARSVWSGSKSCVIESRKVNHRGGLPIRNTEGSTEPAAVRRPSKGRRPWWKRLDRDLRAGQMLVWITWEHGRSPYSLPKNRNRARRLNKCPGVAIVLGCCAEKTNTAGEAPGERRAKQALWKRGSLSTLIVPLESWETQPLGSQ